TKRKKKTAKLPPTTLPLITPTKTQGHLPIATHPEGRRKESFKFYCYLGWLSISLASLENLLLTQRLVTRTWRKRPFRDGVVVFGLVFAMFPLVFGFYLWKPGLT
ncbi:MAG: hypothetical protein L7H05_04550, partial [Vulcanisaeta sp.]|nr:hypothetical protein [Vulcanisaeta sp.]